ncbi:hypothetical protein M413DRAFT_194380 [Hebeloma cylindrosporum]|uniref:Uncharacterized protein n=1 Tax=Hebeloma cylindrosporum TaxID=76867 RepID=A0A0C3C7V4_HEBCY|nr:hypothetical protein M413DRAFT_194380 [Hebeloma cylindrosporum h7]
MKSAQIFRGSVQAVQTQTNQERENGWCIRDCQSLLRGNTEKSNLHPSLGGIVHSVNSSLRLTRHPQNTIRPNALYKWRWPIPRLMNEQTGMWKASNMATESISAIHSDVSFPKHYLGRVILSCGGRLGASPDRSHFSSSRSGLGPGTSISGVSNEEHVEVNCTRNKQ